MFAYIFIITILMFTVFCIATIMLMDEYRRKIRTSWNETMSAWKARYDAIAALIEFSKLYMPDKKYYFGVLQAKSNCHTAKTPAALIAANNTFGEEYGKLLALITKNSEAENSEVFRKIHMDIISLEEKLAFEKSFYADYVKIYNRIIQTFPTSTVASLFKYKPITVDLDQP